jgi:dTMP kinase
MKKCTNGFLIAFEGIDGSGKSTLAQSLYALLKEEYVTVLTRQPGGTDLGGKIRELLHHRSTVYSPRAEYLLFAADRAQHAFESIIPALTAGSVIICDRYADSSLAYQAYGRGLPIDMIQTINTWATQNIMADITFYIALSYQESLTRVKKRNDEITAFEQEKEDYFKRVIAGFEALYTNRTNVIILDGTLSKEMLLQQAYDAVLKKLQDRSC